MVLITASGSVIVQGQMVDPHRVPSPNWLQPRDADQRRRVGTMDGGATAGAGEPVGRAGHGTGHDDGAGADIFEYDRRSGHGRTRPSCACRRRPARTPLPTPAPAPPGP